MRYKEALIKTQREKGQGVEAISHDMSLRSGIIYQVSSGLYDFLPLGQRVLGKIENIVREEINRTGALEVSMPILNPSELWIESDRWDIYGDGMFKLKNRDGRDFCLAPTHEETMCQFARSHIDSYKQLPFKLYQIGRKMRDEMRPRHGLLRTKEFLMKDAYSFDVDESGLDLNYEKMRDAYLKIFDRVGIEIVSISADPGEIGGTGSEEFLAPAEIGEDLFVVKNGIAQKNEDLKEKDRESSKRGIEVGHIFKLGDRYSKLMNVKFTDNDGSEKYVIMGCYGLGLSRFISSVIEQNHDEHGIIWPIGIAPFDATILQLGRDEEIRQKSEEIYRNLRNEGVDVLFDDRDATAGVEFHDADLIGIPYRFIVGSKYKKNGIIGLEKRDGSEKIDDKSDSLVETYMRLKNHETF